MFISLLDTCVFFYGVKHSINRRNMKTFLREKRKCSQNERLLTLLLSLQTFSAIYTVCTGQLTKAGEICRTYKIQYVFPQFSEECIPINQVRYDTSKKLHFRWFFSNVMYALLYSTFIGSIFPSGIFTRFPKFQLKRLFCCQ